MAITGADTDTVVDEDREEATQAHKKEVHTISIYFSFFRSFSRIPSKMQQKWLILTKIDDKILRIYYGYPSMYMG